MRNDIATAIARDQYILCMFLFRLIFSQNHFLRCLLSNIIKTFSHDYSFNPVEVLIKYGIVQGYRK